MTRCRTLAAASVVLLCACHSEENLGDTAGVEPPASWNSIPDGKPSGRLHGLDFEMKDARMSITDQPGRQWVTIRLSAASAADPCGPLEPEKAASVWIRLPGAAREALSVRELTRAAGDADGWSVHYQIPQEGEPWIGRSRAAALFAIRRSVPGFGIEGELAACFADGMGSCVSGSFSARECPNPVSPDVREIDPTPPMPPRPKASASASASAAASGAPPPDSVSASASAGAAPSAPPSP